MLTEAWKPPKPWGWLMSPDVGTGEHVPCNPGELHGGGGEIWGFGGDCRALCPLWGQDRVVHPRRPEHWVAPGAC